MKDEERDDDAGGYGWSEPDASSGGDESAGGGDGGGDGGSGGGIKLPRHEFVTKLVKDPSNVSDDDALVLLNGFAGDSDEDGYTRLYCDPTLESYTDVKDEDILHYEEDGMVGYRVWARKGAQVRQGKRGQKKGESGSFFSGPLLKDYGGGQGTGGQGTGGQAEVQTTVIGPTGWRYCTLITCPPTHHQECTWICPLPSTTRCLPPSFECPPGGQGGGGAQGGGGPIGVTGWLGCTHMLGCPRTSTCPPTHMPGCPSSSTCPPQGGGADALAGAQGGGGQSTAATVCTQVGCHPIGITGWYGCQQPSHSLATVCTQHCGHTHLLGCPGTSTCPPHGGGGGGGAADAQGGGGQSTAATVCTQVGCHPIGITGWYGCHQPTHSTATLCTQIGCGHTHLLGCPSSSTCPPHGGGAADAVQGGGGQSTAATVCTQIGCGHGTIHPTIWTQIGCSTQAGCIHPTTWTQIGCGPGPVIPQGGGGANAVGAAQGGDQSTAATLCTQVGCIHPTIWTQIGCEHTQALGCPSSSTCPPQGGGGGAHGMAAAPGPHTYGPACTLGFTCTYVGCPGTAPQNTAATVCTQLGCGHTHLLGCPSSSTCPPHGTAATVCTQVGCPAGPGPHTYSPGCTLGFTCTYVGCPR